MGGYTEMNPAQELRDQELLQEKRSEERWNECVGCTLTQTLPGFQVEKSDPGLFR